MLWSKYNYLFRSEKYGWLLYNALSNCFLALPDKAGELLSSLKAGDECGGLELGLQLQLAAMHALVAPGEDRKMRDVVRMKRRMNNLSEGIFLLTVAPTRSCNFACPYCFENNRAGVHMSAETEDKLVEFVRRHQPGAVLAVTWFGGEPLLRFEQIRRLSDRFMGLNFRSYRAALITNGYLLDAEKCASLEGLGIREVQITLDGMPDTHNARRKLVSGGGTFDRILSNIDLLFASEWRGALLLRVNVDKSNTEDYHLLYEFIRKRYPDYVDRIKFYPGIVHAMGRENPDTSCLFNVDEAVDFELEQYYKHGLRGNFYPGRMLFNCTAARRNGYVVGPEGELYKCWNDIGIKEREIGHVALDKPWNNMLLAEWMEGCCAMNDPECLECTLMPVCDGGCPAVRMAGERNCSRFRNRMAALLEAHYTLLRAKGEC